MRKAMCRNDHGFFFTKNVSTFFVELECDRLRSAKNGHDRFLRFFVMAAA